MARKISLLILCLLLLLATGCKKKSIQIDSPNNEVNDEEIIEENSDDTVAKPKTLRLTSVWDIPGLDSSLATDTVSFEVLGNTLEGLFVLTGYDELQKGVCESYTVSEDGKTYTFKLRKDSVWSNGDLVTAHDFVYSWRRLANPETGGQYSFILETANIKNSSAVINGDIPIDKLGVYAKDDYTLVVDLEHPVPYLPSLLSFPSFLPLNEEFVEEKGEEFGTSVENTLFNGPYVLHEWEVESHFVYKKNESYWNKDAIKIEEVIVTIVKDLDIAFQMYRSGKLDFTYLSQEEMSKFYDYEFLSTRAGFVFEDLIWIPGVAVYYFEFNQENELLRNVNFRKAIALSIDKRHITDEILCNGYIPADYLVPVNFAYDSEGKDFRETTESYNHYNPKEAKKYWEEAKKELGIENTSLILRIFGSETSSKVADYVIEQLQSNLEGLLVEKRDHYFGGKFPTEEQMKTDIELSGWGPDYLDPMTFLEMWTTDSGHNTIEYSNEEFDSIIEMVTTGDLSLNPEKRWSELQRAEKILIEEDPALVPIYQRGYLGLLKSHVLNWHINSFAPDRYWGTMDIVE